MNITIPDLTNVEAGWIAITAAEGGIGYWSVIDEYRPSRWTQGDDDGVSDLKLADDFVFYTLEWEGRQPAEEKIDVTPALLRRGFERMAQAPLDEGGWPVPKLLGMAREDWTGEIDSDIADMLVQFGAFGEVVFG